MIPHDFESFITSTKTKLENAYPNLSKVDRILGQAVKHSEEYGELCSEILSTLQLQRLSKLSHAKRSHLEKEWVDAFFTLIALGMELEIPIQKAIESRMKTIAKRR